MKTIKFGLCGLDYVYISAPVKHTEDGDEYIDIPHETIDRAIARELILQCVPLNGAEVKFLRKCLGMPLDRWAKEFDMSAAGVMKWEKNREKRLSRVNEIAVRLFIADKLEISEMNTKWNHITRETEPNKLAIAI